MIQTRDGSVVGAVRVQAIVFESGHWFGISTNARPALVPEGKGGGADETDVAGKAQKLNRYPRVQRSTGDAYHLLFVGLSIPMDHSTKS